MTEHKYTDEEVIKAFECCANTLECRKCPFVGEDNCTYRNINHVLDLINRQKAEIERLEHIRADLSKENDRLKEKHSLAVAEREANVKGFTETLETIKYEAINEFVERMKEKSSSIVSCHNGVEIPETKTYQISAPSLDDLVKELTEEKT